MNTLIFLQAFIFLLQGSSNSLLPLTGIAQEVGRTNRERGVANILFVPTALKKLYLGLDYQLVTFMSNPMAAV